MDYLNTTPLIAYTKHTITDRSVLEQQLEQVRITGIAYSLEEYEEDQISISVPIYSFEKSVIAALCICWPNFRHTEEKKERAIKHLIAIAQDISTAMGYHGA
jgi:IclR family KDG regulon transcriptional repressor